jgi:prenyltransferase beta subunit
VKNSNYTQDEHINQLMLKKALVSLFLILPQYLEKSIELERISRVSALLIKGGANKNNYYFQEILRRCLLEQKPDGGWIDVSDSIWSVALLKEYERFTQAYKNGLNWIKDQEQLNGSFGKTKRDIGRITITGPALFLLPELSNKITLQWLEEEWKKEFALRMKLSYKCSFVLMATKSSGCRFRDPGLLDSSFTWLSSQQNEDYGWGPCKGHPIGSTPFCTGVALAGLLQYPEKVDRNIVCNCIKWLEKKQLEDGLWPDHYIEEGSAWCFYALTQGYKFLKGSQ